MNRKWKNDTEGGHSILSLHGPDPMGDYAGIVEDKDGILLACMWDEDGTEYDDESDFNLVEEEPEVMYAFYEVRDCKIMSSGTRANPARNLKLGFVDDVLVSAEVLK